MGPDRIGILVHQQQYRENNLSAQTRRTNNDTVILSISCMCMPSCMCMKIINFLSKPPNFSLFPLFKPLILRNYFTKYNWKCWQQTKTRIMDTGMWNEKSVVMIPASLWTWLMHMCAMTYSYVGHHSSVCVAWLIRMWDVTHLYVKLDSRVLYTYIYIYVYIYTYTYIRICIYTCMYVHVYMYVYTYIYIYLYIHTYMYAYIRRACIYIYMYIYTCIHTYKTLYTHQLLGTYL